MESDKRVNVAMIGLGKMGLLHASLLSVLPNVRVVALCDKSRLIRKVCRRLLPGAFLTDDVAKLAGLDLDVVYVTTPIPSHFSVIKTIYKAGVASNVFVEKTLAACYDEAKELCDLAAGFGGVNMVGYMKRFCVTFQKAKELLNDGVIGEVEFFEAYAYSSDFASIDEGSIPSSRGGVLGDLGSHALDLALWYFGDLKVESAELKSLCGSSVDDAVSVKVSGLKGVQGHFDMSWCKTGFRMPEVGLVVHGTRGELRVTDDEVSLKLNNGESRKWCRHDLNDNVGFLLGGPEYFREDEHFIKTVMNGDCAELNFSTASKVDFLIDKIRKSAQKNE